MRGRLKVMVVIIFFFLILSLTTVLAMPYQKLDWEDYGGAYHDLRPRVYLPLVMHGG
jgi:hypothetical protein